MTIHLSHFVAEALDVKKIHRDESIAVGPPMQGEHDHGHE